MKESPKCGICDYSYTILALGGVRTKSESVLVNLIPAVKSSHHDAKLIPNLLCSACVNYKLLRLETDLLGMVSESSELVYLINTVLQNCLSYKLMRENEIETNLKCGVHNLYLGLLQVESHIILRRILKVENRSYKEEVRNSQLKQRIENLLSEKKTREADISKLRFSLEKAHKKRRIDQELNKRHFHEKLDFLERSISTARANLLQALVSILSVEKSLDAQLRLRQVPVLHIQDMLLYDRDTTNSSLQSVILFQQLTSKYLGIKLPFDIRMFNLDNTNQKQECDFQARIGKEPRWYLAGIPENLESTRDTLHCLSTAVACIVSNFLTLNKKRFTWESSITLYELFDINSFIWSIIGHKAGYSKDKIKKDKLILRSFVLASNCREALSEKAESEQLTKTLHQDNKRYLQSKLISKEECADLTSLNANVYDFFHRQLKVIDSITDDYPLKDVTTSSRIISSEHYVGTKGAASKNTISEMHNNESGFHFSNSSVTSANAFIVSKRSYQREVDSNVSKGHDEKWEIVELQ